MTTATRTTIAAASTPTRASTTHNKQTKHEPPHEKKEHSTTKKQKKDPVDVPVAVEPTVTASTAERPAAEPTVPVIRTVVQLSKNDVTAKRQRVPVVTPTKAEEAAQVQQRSRQESRARHNTMDDHAVNQEPMGGLSKKPKTTPPPTTHETNGPILTTPSKKRKWSSPSSRRHPNYNAACMGVTAAVALVAMTRSSYKWSHHHHMTSTLTVVPTPDTTRLWNKVPSEQLSKYWATTRRRIQLSHTSVSSRTKQKTTSLAIPISTKDEETTHTSMTAMSKRAVMFQKMKEWTESVLDDL